MKVRLVKDVVWTKLDEEVAILNSSTGTYFGLDPVGSRIWCLLADGLGFDEVISTLLKEYSVEEERVRGDVKELIDQLAGKSLLEILT
jgi:hypothetical protein